jgi:hypothetical protein
MHGDGLELALVFLLAAVIAVPVLRPGRGAGLMTIRFALLVAGGLGKRESLQPARCVDRPRVLTARARRRSLRLRAD